jgi:CRISPR-associated protein Csm3|tara:strand:- start:3090 stop:3773 length:684 start_codon:yes stop_codon:yes gene_type:complete
MQLEHIYEIKAQIELLSGLHIGAGKGAIEIGGMDSPVIKHPLTQEPYIPGSTLKGKLRSMLEIVYTPDQVADGKPSSDGIFAVMFGTSNDKNPGEFGPTRVILRDALMNPDDQRRFQEGRLPMEEKHEISMNRLTGTAQQGMLRNMERVPAGLRFSFTLSLRKFENDGEKYLDYVWRGLRLIELDGIGGSVSRGSGQVRFADVEMDGSDANDLLRSKEVWRTQEEAK